MGPPLALFPRSEIEDVGSNPFVGMARLNSAGRFYIPAIT